jgi:hypothetical protein
MSARLRRVAVVAVWLVFSVLEFLDGSVKGGVLFGTVGLGFYALITTMQHRSTVDVDGETFVVRNWPMKGRAFARQDVIKVRQGRGANSVVSEVLMNRPRGAKYISVWAIDGSRFAELEKLLKSDRKSPSLDAQ